MNVTAAVGVVLCFAVALDTWRDYKARNDLLKTHGEELVQFTAKAVSAPLWSMDTNAVNEILKLVTSDPYYAGIIIREVDGTEIVVGDSAISDAVMHFSHPVILYDDAKQERRKIADLELILSKEILHDFLYSKIVEEVLLLLLLLGINLWVIHRSLHVLRQPIKELTKSMRLFSKGDYQQSVFGVGRLDEFGVMAESLEILRNNSIEREEIKNQLLEANRVKDDFLASMSHELRTPLTSIIGNSEFLLDEEGCGSNDRPHRDAEKILRSIQNAGKNQLALVNDILDMSKIESGKFTIDEGPYDLSSILAEIKQMFSVRAADSEITFVLDQQHHGKYMLMGDVQRIYQILINLIGNAFKFTEKGEVRLTVWVHADQLHFQVKDTGVGISPEQLDKLFQRFHQADGTISRRFGGTGLGLYISENLADMMDGHIDASSEEGKGSIFQLVLPYKQTEILAYQKQKSMPSTRLIHQITHKTRRRALYLL